MSETFKTLHGSEVPAMATGDAISDPRDWGALLAFHHWRDFMRGRTRMAACRPDSVAQWLTEPEAIVLAAHAYRRHWRDSAFREAAR